MRVWTFLSRLADCRVNILIVINLLVLACKFWDFEWYRENYKQMLTDLCAASLPPPAVMETDVQYFQWREQLLGMSKTSDVNISPMCQSMLLRQVEVPGMPSQ